MSWWEFRTELFPELLEDERWTSRYPLPALRAFLSVDLDERSAEELDQSPPRYPDCIAEEMQAFRVRWGGLETETFLHVLQAGFGANRLLAMFAVGFSEDAQAADVLAPLLESSELLERCAATYLLALRHDPRAVPHYETYLREDPPRDVYGRFVANAHNWFWTGRAFIARTLATGGPAGLTPALREAWLRQWWMEQEYGHIAVLPLLHDTLLYALGGRGAMGALHGIRLPASRQHLTMVLLALGWLQADDTCEHLSDALRRDEQFQRKVAQVISTHFALPLQESLHAVTSYYVDYLDLRSSYEPGQSEELDRSMAHTIELATRLMNEKMQRLVEDEEDQQD
jgi:hypothetical protein